MSTDPEKKQRGTISYILLFATQVLGALFLIRSEVPLFRQMIIHPGDQPQYPPFYNYILVGTLIAMQCSYWYRLLRIPIPYRGPNTFLSHAFLFLGRLSFIFGGALFSVVFFRHLPELGPDTDIFVSAVRSLLLAASLFTLFCVTLELERLGNALDTSQRK